MKLTRQHFQMIADEISATRQVYATDEKAQRLLTVLACSFAARLRSSNPQFSEDRFLRACD